MHWLVIDKNMVRGACTRVDKEMSFWRRIHAYMHRPEPLFPDVIWLDRHVTHHDPVEPLGK